MAAWVYRQCGDLPRSALVARRVVAAPDVDITDPVLFQLAFPRPYDSVVAENATAYSVPVDLLYAIMREESSFNPSAMSPRRARGLMQMINRTARRMAKDANIKRFRMRQLFDPPARRHRRARIDQLIHRRPQYAPRGLQDEQADDDRADPIDHRPLRVDQRHRNGHRSRY